MQLTYTDILTLLAIIALAMTIVLLYHLIFVSVSLRRISERWDDLSKEVEGLIIKPIGAIEFVIDWFSSFVEGMRIEKEEKKAHHHKKAHHDAEVEE